MSLKEKEKTLNEFEIEKQFVEREKEKEKNANPGVYVIPEKKLNVIKKALSIMKNDGKAQDEPAIITQELKNSEQITEQIIFLTYNTTTSYCSFLTELDSNEINYKNQKDLKKINDIKDKLSSLKCLKDEEILAVYIYTSDLRDSTGTSVYTQVNDILRQKLLEKIKGYKVFISLLCKAIFKLANVWDTVYRGTLLTKEEIEDYKQGDTIMWNAFSSSSIDRERAEGFSKPGNNHNQNEKSVILKINLARAPLIDKLSRFPQEKEVLFSAFTCFEVKSIQLTKDIKGFEFTEIEMTEIGTENNAEKKILIWVDNNLKYISSTLNREIDENKIQLKTITSTEGAMG